MSQWLEITDLGLTVHMGDPVYRNRGIVLLQTIPQTIKALWLTGICVIVIYGRELYDSYLLRTKVGVAFSRKEPNNWGSLYLLGGHTG